MANFPSPTLRTACSALLLAVGTHAASPSLHGQESRLAVAGGLGPVVVDGRFGGSLAVGPRLARNRLVVSALGEVVLVRGHGDTDGYDWGLYNGRLRCTSSEGAVVDDDRCLDLEPRVAALFDAAIALEG